MPSLNLIRYLHLIAVYFYVEVHIVCFGLCRTINQLQMGAAPIQPQCLLDSRQINFGQKMPIYILFLV